MRLRSVRFYMPPSAKACTDRTPNETMPIVTWQRLGLSLVVYEVFLIGTQWLFFGGVSGIATVVFTAFFLVVMKPWTPRRREPPDGAVDFRADLPRPERPTSQREQARAQRGNR